jgi:hypothetical protein
MADKSAEIYAAEFWNIILTGVDINRGRNTIGKLQLAIYLTPL